MGAAPEPRTQQSAWYLYGVVAADAEPRFPPRMGVDPDHDVTLLVEGELAGVTSRVSLDEFDDDALPERLADTVWLELKIRGHEHVLEAVLDQTAVVPCRFCTVFRDSADLRRFLAERRDVLVDALARVTGRVELGVKAFATPAAPERNEVKSGREYLEARRLEQRARQEAAERRARISSELHERLLIGAEDGVPLALQRPELSGHEEEMLFNGAYLVGDRDAFERVLAQVWRDYRDGGVKLELTGPWPPYNFVPAELGSS